MAHRLPGAKASRYGLQGAINQLGMHCFSCIALAIIVILKDARCRHQRSTSWPAALMSYFWPFWYIMPYVLHRRQPDSSINKTFSRILALYERSVFIRRELVCRRACISLRRDSISDA